MASRLAPIRWIWICDSKVVGVDFVQLAEVGVARAGDQHLDVAELLGGLVHETFDRVRVGDVEGKRDRLAAVGTDLVGDVLALLDAACAQRHRKAMRGELDGGGLADAR